MADMTAPETVYRVPKVAAMWETTPDLIYRLIAEGKLRAVRVGRLIRVPESALAEFISGGDQ